jgi:hypothetical protein
VATPAAPKPAGGDRKSAGGNGKLSDDEFQAAIAMELRHGTPAPQGQPGPAPSPPQLVLPPAPAAFDPAALTLDGLASAWQVPFYVLAKILQLLKLIGPAEPIQAVGRRRSMDLARPSYAIYEHYAREYLGIHPENGVQAAAGVTALNAVGILPELIDAIMESRELARTAAVAPEAPAPA